MTPLTSPTTAATSMTTSAVTAVMCIETGKPIPGRDIFVQAWYQGGVSIVDFTDTTHPFEIAYFDRGPLDATKRGMGGYWSAYWYNGYIYGSEIARGVDVFKLKT